MSDSNTARLAEQLKGADGTARQFAADRSVGETVQSCPLRHDHALEICVLDPDDVPLADVAVEIVNADKTALRSRTDTAGNARFDGLPPGSYLLSLYELDEEVWSLVDTAPLPPVRGDSAAPADWQGYEEAPAQAFSHLVQDGECTARLAARYGYLPETVWEDPANAALRAARASMHILSPLGDTLVFPAQRRRELAVTPGVRYTVRRHSARANLAIRFLDESETARACQRYLMSLTMEDDAVAVRDRIGTTDASGFLRERVAPTATSARIIIDSDGFRHVYDVALSTVPPIETDAGLLRRLRNLGFSPPGEGPDVLRRAVAAFQWDQGLEPTGMADEATTRALRDAFLS